MNPGCLLEADVYILYGQIAVFRKTAEEAPFPVWTDTLVAQGFAWRPGVVALLTPFDSGSCQLSVYLVDTPMEIRQDSAWAFAAPYNAVRGTTTEVATILQSRELEIPEGRYRVIYEVSKTCPGHIRIQFVPEGNASAEVLRQDADLDPPVPLKEGFTPA